MKFRSIVLLLLASLAIASCEKNAASKIPSIGLTGFGPQMIKVNVDTCFLTFSLTDGDADLGNAQGSGQYDIYVKDFRFDTGYAGYYFPGIDGSIEDPRKGLSGTCQFQFTPYILTPRTDSIHITVGDTTHFEVYIKDRAGNSSNHIVTGNVILHP